MNKPSCWKCGSDISSVIVDGRVEFRATCPKCFSDIHVCKGCKFYLPGKPNDCLVPGTEWVADREKNNLCEEFKPISSCQQTTDVEGVADKLFGKDAKDEIAKSKKPFEKLFDE